MAIGDWTDKQECLENIVHDYDIAKDKNNDWYDNASSTIAAINAISDSATKTACTKIYTQSLYNAQSIKAMLSYYDNSYDPPYPIPYFLDNHVGGDTFVLTWDDIVAAWIEAPVSGRLWTVLAIDAMRSEVWNEWVESFAMAKGLDDW